jgi:hypothetical protein
VEMLVGLLTIQQGLHSRVNDLRSIQRIVESIDFESIYKQATEAQQRIVIELINGGDKDAVQLWMAVQERDRSNIEELPVKELRRLACSLGIAGYHFLPKASLLSSISSKELDRWMS